MSWAFGAGINEVLFNLYLLEAGFGEDFIGFFLSISLFLTGALAIFVGILADRFPRKRMILVGYTVVLLSIFIQYSTLNPVFLLGSQLLNGIGFAITGVCWQPYTISVTTEEERVHVFSIRFALFMVASFFGSLTGGFLPTIWESLGFTTNLLGAYRFSLWTALVPMSIGALIVTRMATDQVDTTRVSFGISRIRNRMFIGKYALAWTLSGLAAGLFVQFFNVFYRLAFSLDEATIGIIFALNTLVTIGANFASPAIVERFGILGTIIWFQVASLPFLALLAWSPTLTLAILSQMGRGLFIYIAFPVMDVFYMENLEKEERATAMGVINAGDALSRAVGLNIGGWFLAIGLLRAHFALALIFYIISVVLFYYFFGGTKMGPEKDQEVLT
jgi:MFS family permease